MGEPRPGLAPVGRRGPGHRHDRPQQEGAGAPDPGVLRQALFSWAFNPATRDTTPPPHIAAALDWAGRASLPVTDLEDTATVRLALGACAKTLAGKPAAGSTQRRKRSVFYNALGYAVELGHLGSNPVDRIQWTAPAVAASVDRRVVVSPAQAATLLTAAGRLGQRGEHLETFFAVLYYAALRPSEAVMLREADLHLLKAGWGRIVLAASASRAGRAWTDEGTARQERGLKHRADPGPAAARPHQAVRHDPRRAELPDRPGRHPAGLRLQRGLGPGPQGSAHPRPVQVTARPPPLRPAARGGVAMAELRCPRPRSPAVPGTASRSC